ncbi:MAG: hypothetical protein U1E36_00305 [Rickettsiales bacterium]
MSKHSNGSNGFHGQREAAKTYSNRVQRREKGQGHRHDDPRHKRRKINRTLGAEAELHTEHANKVLSGNGTNGHGLNGNGSEFAPQSQFHVLQDASDRNIEIARNSHFVIYMHCGDHTPIHVHVQTLNPDAEPQRARFVVIDNEDGTLSTEPYPYTHAPDANEDGSVKAAPLRRAHKFNMNMSDLTFAKGFVGKHVDAIVDLWHQHNGPATPLKRTEADPQMFNPDLLFGEEEHRAATWDARDGTGKVWGADLKRNSGGFGFRK